MNPTLYTAKNNGGNNNGDSTTMANDGIGFRDIWSAFPSSHYGAVLELYGSIKVETIKKRAVLLTMWWDVWGFA